MATYASADGVSAVSGSSDHSLRVWDLSEGITVHVLAGHASKVHALAVDRDRAVVSGSADRTVRVWSLHGTAEPTVLSGHTKVPDVDGTA